MTPNEYIGNLSSPCHAIFKTSGTFPRPSQVATVCRNDITFFFFLDLLESDKVSLSDNFVALVGFLAASRMDCVFLDWHIDASRNVITLAPRGLNRCRHCTCVHHKLKSVCYDSPSHPPLRMRVSASWFRSERYPPMRDENASLQLFRHNSR